MAEPASAEKAERRAASIFRWDQTYRPGYKEMVFKSIFPSRNEIEQLGVESLWSLKTGKDCDHPQGGLKDPHSVAGNFMRVRAARCNAARPGTRRMHGLWEKLRLASRQWHRR